MSEVTPRVRRVAECLASEVGTDAKNEWRLWLREARAVIKAMDNK